MGECEEHDTPIRKYLMEQVKRGGLCTPTELIYRSCLYNWNWNFYRTLSAQGSFLDEVYKSRNSKATYVHMATLLMAEGILSSQILKKHYSCNHSFETVFPKIYYRMLNLMTWKLHIQDQRFYPEEEASMWRKQKVNSNKKNQQPNLTNHHSVAINYYVYYILFCHCSKI